jgi:hypothetical protein
VTDFTGELDVEMTARETVQHLARTAAKLTEADQAELVRFAEFLRSKAPTKREG